MAISNWLQRVCGEDISQASSLLSTLGRWVAFRNLFDIWIGWSLQLNSTNKSASSCVCRKYQMLQHLQAHSLNLSIYPSIYSSLSLSHGFSLLSEISECWNVKSKPGHLILMACLYKPTVWRRRVWCRCGICENNHNFCSRIAWAGNKNKSSAHIAYIYIERIWLLICWNWFRGYIWPE